MTPGLIKLKACFGQRLGFFLTTAAMDQNEAEMILVKHHWAVSGKRIWSKAIQNGRIFLWPIGRCLDQTRQAISNFTKQIHVVRRPPLKPLERLKKHNQKDHRDPPKNQQRY